MNDTPVAPEPERPVTGRRLVAVTALVEIPGDTDPSRLSVLTVTLRGPDASLVGDVLLDGEVHADPEAVLPEHDEGCDCPRCCFLALDRIARDDAPAAVLADARELLDGLPAFCGPLGDLNRDPRCPRAGRLYRIRETLTGVLDVGEQRNGARAKWRHDGLGRWLTAYGPERLTTVRGWLAELPDCTHPESERAVLTFDEALPPCTCGDGS